MNEMESRVQGNWVYFIVIGRISQKQSLEAHLTEVNNSQFSISSRID